MGVTEINGSGHVTHIKHSYELKANYSNCLSLHIQKHILGIVVNMLLK